MAGKDQQGSSGASVSATVDPNSAEVAGPEPASATTVPSAGRWRLGNWRLRSKLMVVLLIPLLVAAALGALQVANQVGNALIYDRLQNDSRISASLSSVIDNLQREREQVALYAASNKSAGAGAGSAQADATDQAIVSFKQLAGADGSDSPETQAAVVNAQIALSDLDSLRSTANSTEYPDVAILGGYDQIIAALLQDSQVTESGVADQQVYTLVNGLNQLRQAKEQFSQTIAILMITAQLGSFPGLQEDALRSAEAQYNASIAAFTAGASPADQAMYANTVTGPDVDQASTYLTQIEDRVDAHQPIQVGAQQVQTAGDATAKLTAVAENNMYNELTSVTNSLAATAIGTAVKTGLAVLLGLVIAFLVALFVARSLVRTLQQLRSGALDVARHRLPQSVQRILADPDPIKASEEAVEPVPVFTADEIGEVARSFDVVHGQAVRLAAEQAVLRDNVNAIFVNLARRSQVLVERQLSLIDRLERDEQDPDQLSNLFELDHLATRMRRNSESLLVLSGSGLAKRMSQPVPIGDLVGAAVSEVEQYARVEVGSPPNAQILGRVVNDLIHLVAELLDNATVFSEPNTKVSVRIAKTRAREVAIQITDRGVGMSDEDVRFANERLANPPEMDVGVTRRMGLYVVARLAKRHNIRVKLRANEDIDGGTVALVVIGEDLIHQAGVDPQGQQQGGDRALPQVPAARTEGSAPAGAVAAAGIAGAFGMARRSEGPAPADAQQVAVPDFSVQDQAREEQDDPLDPATSFWSNEFALDEADASGGQPATPAEPTVTNMSPAPQPNSANHAATEQASSLWEAHTAAAELPAINEASTTDSGVRDRLSAAPTRGAAALTGSSPGRNATDRASAGKEAALEVDAPTERLPIYEAVLSQWFRPDEVAQPGSTVDGAGSPSAAAPAAPVAPASAPVAAAAPPPAPAPAAEEPKTTTGTGNGLLPTRVPGKAGAAAGFGTGPRSQSADATLAPNIMEPAPTPQPTAAQVASAANAAWETPADEGWQLAEALLSSPVSETTGAGLPKRVPKAHLVPGSAAARSNPAQAEQPPLPPRTADAVRGRMSSFQRGVRRGRHALIEAYSGGASPLSDGSHDEEHE